MTFPAHGFSTCSSPSRNIVIDLAAGIGRAFLDLSTGTGGTADLRVFVLVATGQLNGDGLALGGGLGRVVLLQVDGDEVPQRRLVATVDALAIVGRARGGVPVPIVGGLVDAVDGQVGLFLEHDDLRVAAAKRLGGEQVAVVLGAGKGAGAGGVVGDRLPRAVEEAGALREEDTRHVNGGEVKEVVDRLDGSSIGIRNMLGTVALQHLSATRSKDMERKRIISEHMPIQFRSRQGCTICQGYRRDY